MKIKPDECKTKLQFCNFFCFTQQHYEQMANASQYMQNLAPDSHKVYPFHSMSLRNHKNGLTQGQKASQKCTLPSRANKGF